MDALARSHDSGRKLGDLQRRPAVGTLHLAADLNERLAHRAQDVRRLHECGPLGRSLGLHLRRHQAQVERRRAAVQADVSRLRDPVVLIEAVGVEMECPNCGAPLEVA